ncbi:MAG TPA: hypothetical protein VKQ28_14340 [Candidatus Acidoferrum sp.]|nr:hypothetical protein [Candidatus Acidoferrum sp.]
MEMAAGIASIGGAILSVFGLFYSYRAAKRAQAATEAAREAREAVRRSDAGEELRALSEMAKELLRSTQNKQFEAAKLRSTDLLAGVAQARHRWKMFFLDDSPERIDKVTRKLDQISQAVSAPTIAVDVELTEKVLKSCHDVVVLLADESGKLLKQLEGSAQ